MNAMTEYLETYFDELEPREFYRGIFPEGELQKAGEYEPGVYNGIAVAVTREKKSDGKTPKIKRYTVTDDLDVVDELCKTDYFCLMSPISYAGKERNAQNARYLYAFAVDVDLMRYKDGMPIGLMNLWERHIEAIGRIPKPTYIVSSGTGLHLYYVLDKPLALYQEKQKQLQRFKFALTDLIWHDTIVGIKSKKDIQQEGIFQGFRVPGTITKTGSRTRAFLTGSKVTMDYLNRFVPAHSRVSNFVEKGHLSLAAAKEKYPDWYERRIERQEPRGVWHVSRNLYDWWRGKIFEGATVGHRYHCLRILAMYAAKCSMYDEKHNPNPVTREELERDAWMIMRFMEGLTNSDDNHFDEGDVLAALSGFDEKWITYPRKEVEFRSGIAVPANKRNGRTRKIHIARVNRARKADREEFGENTYANNGRPRKPSKAAIVAEWHAAHPTGNKSECSRDLGISRTTVVRYWDYPIGSVADLSLTVEDDV